MLCGTATVTLLKGDYMSREEWEALYYADRFKGNSSSSSFDDDDEYSVEREDYFDSDCKEEFE